MKPEPTLPRKREPGTPARQLRITSIRCKYAPTTVGVEIHDEGESLQRVASRLISKRDMGDVYEADSTRLDIWVSGK